MVGRQGLPGLAVESAAAVTMAANGGLSTWGFRTISGACFLLFMIQRSWVQTLGDWNLGCVVLLSEQRIFHHLSCTAETFPIA